MSIENRVGNLFDETDLQVLCHVCNLHHLFGAGIAKVIKNLYPEAYEADLKTLKDDGAKLGTYSFAVAADGKIILNLYAMPRMGAFSYDAFYNVMQDVEIKLRTSKKHAEKPYVIGIPYGIGCQLAGGSWRITTAILEEVFAHSSVKLVIVKLPNQEDLN